MTHPYDSSYPVPIPVGWERSAWFIPGFTSQNQLPGTPAGVVVVPTLPADISLVTAVRTYLGSDGVPVSGSLTFRPTAEYRDTTSNVTIVPRTYRASLVNGVLSVILAATNDPDTSGGFQYKVEEHFPGGRSYKIAVPYNAASPTQLYSLIVP